MMVVGVQTGVDLAVIGEAEAEAVSVGLAAAVRVGVELVEAGDDQ